MRKITNKEFEEYRNWQREQRAGKLLTLKHIQKICSLCRYDSKLIGDYFIDLSNKPTDQTK